MKTRIRRLDDSMQISILAAAMLTVGLASPTAEAARASSAGTHAEARAALVTTAVVGSARGVRVSQQGRVQGAAASAPAPSGAAASAPQSKTEKITQEVKQWVQSKWQAVRELWNGDDVKPQQQVIAEAAKAAKAPVRGPSGTNEPVRAPVARPVAQNLQAPTAAPAADRGPIDLPGMKRTSEGVASYDLNVSEAIPKLDIGKEERVSGSLYALDDRMQKVMDTRIVRALDSPEIMGAKELKALISPRMARAGDLIKTKDVVYSLKGKVSREAFDRIVLTLQPEPKLDLAKVEPLTPDEMRFLSGLLLYQQGDQCPTAIGLFHKLSKVKSWTPESNYFIAMCSKKMGLRTDFYEHVSRVIESHDKHYTHHILKEIDTDVPYEIADRFGAALLKMTASEKIMKDVPPEIMANVSYNLAEYLVRAERYKTALTWAKGVPEPHPKYLRAQFLLALSEYQAGSKEVAIQIQDRIVNDAKIDKAKLEFQALVALNSARMHFQEQNFKAAHENFTKVYKDHPLWLQSLTELGWAQLMNGDYEGAIGSMYSIQSPFFQAVYKPESYVIRTIGYLNLCQYGDAYRTLSLLEREYRPFQTAMEGYIGRTKGKAMYYQTVKSFFGAIKGTKEIDGLPMQIIREMARHRDFTNMQKALNRQVDERRNYTRTDNEAEAHLRQAQNSVSNTRKTIEIIRRKISAAIARKNANEERKQLQAQLDSEMLRLNDQFFYVDMYTEAKSGMDEYRREVIGGADKRIADMRGQIEHVLANRLLRMKVDLARMLDNNELLRYEVFAGSGENIRFQVAGGETAKRIPASILPKSKSLQWEFEGEYWEDEIGHYRSSLRNNCPDRGQQQASLDGGTK